MYRVYWRSRITGKTGHGEPLTRAEAEAAAKIGNAKFPDIDHWVEVEKA